MRFAIEVLLTPGSFPALHAAGLDPIQALHYNLHQGQRWDARRATARMEDLEQRLSHITLAPYIFKAMALIGVKRRAGSNMFRHQIGTFGILLDYKFIDPVLLKASLIHDLFEDAAGMPGVSRDEIIGIDSDAPAVYDLVMEVTLRTIDGVPEPKSEYLIRIMESGSPKAKILKLADRISNLISLGFVHEEAFVRRYLAETRQYILPYAEKINADMFRELSDLVEGREGRLSSKLQS